MTLSEQLKSLAEKATPGPWLPEDDVIMTNEGNLIATIYPGGYTRNGTADDIRREANTCLVAVLRNNLPTILAALEAVEWRPIESAPRDGSWVQLWGPDGYQGCGRCWRNIDFEDATHWRPLGPTPENTHDR